MAYEQAARYYRWALEAGADDRLAVLIELGQAQVLAGEVTAGRTTLAEAGSEALEARRGDDLARAVLAMGGGLGGFEVEVGDSEQIRLLEATLELLPEGDEALRAVVLSRLSVTITGAGAEPRRTELARDAAGMARRVGDAGAEVAALAAQPAPATTARSIIPPAAPGSGAAIRLAHRIRRSNPGRRRPG